MYSLPADVSPISGDSRTVIAGAVVTMLLSAIFNRLALNLSPRFGFVAWPDGLHAHPRPTPLLGGAAMAAAMIPALWVIALSDRFWLVFATGWAMLLALGLWKDRGGTPHFALQLVVQGGVGLLLWMAGAAPPLALPAPLAAATTALFAVVVINAVNFLDVRDGVAGAVMTIVFIGFAAIALNAHAISDAVLGLCFASAAFAFLIHNRPPATIFMGDAGSYTLGFAACTFALRAWNANPSMIASAWLPLFLPILELSTTVGLRLGEGRSPFHGDGRHLTTLLANAGIGPRAMIVVASAVTLVSCAAAVALESDV